MTAKHDYYYEPTDSRVRLVDGDIIEATFGRATVNLEENTAESEWVYNTFTTITADVHPVYVLINLSAVGSAEYNSDRSNELYLKMLKDKHVQRVAVFGLDQGWDLFIKLFQFYAKHKLMVHNTEEQARAWLDTYRHAATD